MSFFRSETYIDDLNIAISSVVDFNKLRNSSVLITGASGLIGSFIIDMLICANRKGACISIYAAGRDRLKLENRFQRHKCDELTILDYDLNRVPEFDLNVDYIVHAASNAHPSAFNTDPVGTLVGNVLGTKNLLDYALSHNTKRFLYISSGEVYGQAELSLEEFSEEYSGYVDPTLARSCYPNAKRATETLCVSYSKQFGLESVIARPSHSFGPNVTKSDNRASAQFIRKGISREDIVLNSAGNQSRSYTYIADAASAILTILLNGLACEAYNVANKSSITTIAGFARKVALFTDTKVVYANPNEVELAERTPIAKQTLNVDKLESLGWSGKFNIDEGIQHTITVLSELG